MDITHIIAFNLALFAAWISPGPAMLFALKTALQDGPLAGIAAGAGLATIAALWTLAALLGLDALFALFPLAYTALKIAGAAYLFWIAYQTWQSARAPLDEGPRAASLKRAFRGGILLNLSNPKSVLFSAAVLVVIFPPLNAAEMALVTFNHVALELVLYTTLALVLSHARMSEGYLRMKTGFDRFAAGVLGLLGLRLLLDRN